MAHGLEQLMTPNSRPNLRFRFVWLWAIVAMLAGCQSMTRQQQLLNPQVASDSLPTLPPSFSQPAQVPKLYSVDPAKVVPARTDTTLVQTSAQVGTEPSISSKNPKVNATPKSIVVDSDLTRMIVSSLVNSSSSIASGNSQAELTPPMSPPPLLDSMIQKTVDSGPKNRPDLEMPVAAPVQKSVVNATIPDLESLPQLKPEQGLLKQEAGMLIPKAALCRSIQGRGNFVAMPASKLNPGSTILVYWELDGLSRKGLEQTASIAATVELVRNDRELIMASVRENLEKTGKPPAEGDFAAMRWSIPTDLQPGEYRLRITATDQNLKTTSQTDLDLTVVPIRNSIVTQ
jgi:hypothetical protein